MKLPVWTSRFVFSLALAILTLALGAPWTQWLMNTSARAEGVPVVDFPLGVMTALVVGGWVLAHFVLRRFTLQRAQLMAGGAGILGMALALATIFGAQFPGGFLDHLLHWQHTFPPELMALLAGAYFWWSGLVIGRSEMAHDILEDMLFRGTIGWALSLALNRQWPAVPMDALVWGLLIFYGVGLSTLALASVERARRRQKYVGGGWLALRHWLATVGGVIALILGSGVALTSLFAPEAWARLIQWLQPIFDFFSPVFDALLFVVLYIATILLGIIFIAVAWVMEGIGGMFQLPPLPQFDLAGLQNAADLVDQFLSNPATQTTSRGTLALVLFFVAVVVFMVALRHYWRLSQRAEVDEVRESVFSTRLLWEQLQNLLKRRPAAEANTEGVVPLLGADPRTRIRRAYQNLLHWASAHDRARLPGQTPTRYAQVLLTTLPDPVMQTASEQAPLALPEALTTLTDAYIRARYAIEPLTSTDAEQAEAASKRLIEPVAH